MKHEQIYAILIVSVLCGLPRLCSAQSAAEVRLASRSDLPPTSTATTIAVSTSVNPSVAGQGVTFSATVTGSTPTGSVTFYKNGVAMATVSLASGKAAYRRKLYS